MPSVKIPKKAILNDMTPFVDVAFLILAFFIMATKFKPSEAVEITTPHSVSSKELMQQDGILVAIDKEGKVYFTMQVEKKEDKSLIYQVIKNINEVRKLSLTEEEMKSFVEDPSVAVPFSKLKAYLQVPLDQRSAIVKDGIPIKDSLSNELYYWVRDAHSAFTGRKINYLIKGDNAAKFPNFKNVLSAFKRNELFKFQLITSPEDVPAGTDLYKVRNAPAKQAG